MPENEIVQSACGLCSAGCGVLITMQDGWPVGVKGDPESPINRGGLCRIGLASLEYLNHPDRLKHPLKRTGERGGNRWARISWDEAFERTAEGLNKIKQASGPESVVMVHGSAKGAMDTHLVRLANAFGTPNVVCSDHVCHVPRLLASELTFGFMPGARYAYPPACVIVWGANMAATRSTVFRNFRRAAKQGTKVISIDPLETGIAKRADLYLQVRPGTDLALALGMIHVIINEGLYDEAFVRERTIGFDRLKIHVGDYPPDRVTEITWVPEELILEAARLYAKNRPGHIEWGNALDQQLNSFQAARALSILMALTGNLGVPGGEFENLGSGFRDLDPNRVSSQIGILGRWASDLELRGRLSAEERKKKLDPELLPDFRYSTPQSVVRAVLEQEPYPVRGMFVQASNPLSCWPNLKKTFRAFQQMDFLVVSDMFMTPTAAMADIVFPAATYLEFDGVQMNPSGAVAQVQKKVAQVGECRSDHEIIGGLAKRLGLGKDFWEKPDDFWDVVLEPVGLTFDEFKKMGRFAAPKKSRPYKQYEEGGFRTPSGKVELYSQQLEDMGFDPLPLYREPPETPLSDPEPAREYPLVGTTWKLGPFRHSGGRQIPSLRNSHPDPLVAIHPDAAARYGIEDGRWIFIETRRGRIRQKANVIPLVDPRVIVMDHAWWFPEKGPDALFGWSDSNYNVLTSDTPPFSREVGSFTVRGLACRVYPA